MIQLTTRNRLPELLNHLGYTGLGLELGVWRGDFSKLILESWPGSMIGVDAWQLQNPESYRDLRNQAQAEQEQYFIETAGKMAPFGSRYQIMRMWSLEAVKNIQDGSLDWIYIDANHRYDAVKADLEAWYPKVRAGGLLAGHDYLDGDACNTDFGVKQAVTEFVAALPYQPKVYVIAEDWPSWYFLKGEK